MDVHEPMDRERDWQLVERYRRGDRRAGGALFEHHLPGLVRFFRGKVDAAFAEELLQDTLLKCIRSIAGFRGDCSFRGFLFMCARSVLIDHYRRHDRDRQREVREMDFDTLTVEDLGQRSLSPEYMAHRAEEERLLLKALRNIPLNKQIALELYYWEHCTTAEIARILDVPVGTARSRLKDGRDQLEKELVRLAASPEVLRSTLDNLARWVERLRRSHGPHRTRRGEGITNG